MHLRPVQLVVMALLVACLTTKGLAEAIGSGITYQGQLKQAGAPANGQFDMIFRLFDHEQVGTAIGGPVFLADVDVIDGLFTVSLNTAGEFGAAAFNGNERWLEITVEGATLTPRQPLTAAPYAAGLRPGLSVAASLPGDVITIENQSSAPGASALRGVNTATSGTTYGVFGSANSNNGSGVYGRMDSISGGSGVLGRTTGAFSSGVRGEATVAFSYAVRGHVSDSNADSAFFEGGRNYFQGNVGINTTNPGYPLNFDTALGDKISLFGTSGNHYGFGIQPSLLQIHADNATSDIAFGFGHSNAFTERVRIKGNGNVGIGTTSPAAKLDVVGTVRAQVVTITGGSDVAEPFNINYHPDDAAPATAIKPGLVVSIDPRHVGEMRIADSPYDRTVAGIISGAGGIRPGMLLTQEGTVADGTHPVAMSGRVWCWCDAEANGPIRAGDLLTTAPTPGHAMKVTDHARATGATIGKAMSSLDSGAGLVLVLVNLQ